MITSSWAGRTTTAPGGARTGPTCAGPAPGLEDLADGGRPAPDWPEILPPPPAQDPPPPLALPLPGSMAGRLKEAIESWPVTSGITGGRAAEVAELTGWTRTRCWPCTASWLTTAGERYMQLGHTGSPRDGRL
jgi:hypothetical protein